MVELQFYMGIVRFGNGIFPRLARSAIQNGIVSTVKDFCKGESAFTAGSIRARPVTVDRQGGHIRQSTVDAGLTVGRFFVKTSIAGQVASTVWSEAEGSAFNGLSLGDSTCSFSPDCAGAHLFHVELSATRLSRAAGAATWLYLSTAHDSGLRVDGKYTPGACRHKSNHPAHRRTRGPVWAWWRGIPSADAVELGTPRQWRIYYPSRSYLPRNRKTRSITRMITTASSRIKLRVWLN
jgi:hypothetical protein